MTETSESFIRRAVFEIVDRAPLAPTVDDLAGRSTPHIPRSRLLLPAVALLVVAGATVLTTRLDVPVDTDSSTTLALSTSLPGSAELAATDAFRILRESTTAVGNMETLAGPLIGSCMTAKGFTFIPSNSVLMSEQSQSAFLLQRYPEPRQQDGVWGYLFFGSTTEATSPTYPNNEITPGYLEALQGTTVLTEDVLDVDGNVVTVGDGCHGQAMAAIFGSRQAYVTFFAQLSRLEVVTGQAWSALHTNPEYIALNEPWAECMKNAGFQYETIFEPQNQDWNSPRPATEEQQVAAADWQCRQGNRLDGADLLPLEEQIVSDLLAESPIGNYEQFELQVQALTAGRFATAVVPSDEIGRFVCLDASGGSPDSMAECQAQLGGGMYLTADTRTDHSFVMALDPAYQADAEYAANLFGLPIEPVQAPR